jgi:hypothetical protein
MKKWLLAGVLSAWASAHPLGWMAGTYHGSSQGSQLEETWTEAGQDLLGTTVWLEAGRVGLRELFRIHPTRSGYHMDLWLTFSDGTGKHLSLDGRREGKDSLVLQGQRGDRLTYSKRSNGGLRCELQKQSLEIFELEPGPGPTPPSPILAGEYVLHTYLGEHVFADELHWTSKQGGTLTVPGKFTAQLENVGLLPGGVSFEIMVPEGKVPYRVRYLMHFSQDMIQATGSLVSVSSGQTIGSFVALKKN